MINRRLWVLSLAAAPLLAALGCGGGPKLHSVTVKLQVDGGNVADLAGSTLDVAVDGDPLKRASATIESDGSAVLETLHAGEIRRGVQEGKYQVRVVLTEDDKESRRKAAKAVAAKYLDFKTSGLTLQVPEDSSPVLKLTPRDTRVSQLSR